MRPAPTHVPWLYRRRSGRRMHPPASCRKARSRLPSTLRLRQCAGHCRRRDDPCIGHDAHDNVANHIGPSRLFQGHPRLLKRWRYAPPASFHLQDAKSDPGLYRERGRLPDIQGENHVSDLWRDGVPYHVIRDRRPERRSHRVLCARAISAKSAPFFRLAIRVRASASFATTITRARTSS